MFRFLVPACSVATSAYEGVTHLLWACKNRAQGRRPPRGPLLPYVTSRLVDWPALALCAFPFGRINLSTRTAAAGAGPCR